MSIIFNDLKKHLEAQDAVMDLIGNHPTHVFYGSVPTYVVNKKGQKVAVGQNAGSYDKMNPYIVIEGDGGDKIRSMGGPSGLRENLYAIRAVGRSISECQRIFLALDDALELQRTAIGDNLWVEHSFLNSPNDTSVVRQDGGEFMLHEMAATLDILCEIT